MNKEYRVASLFSGCGGLDLGFIQNGFNIVWANDFFKEAVETNTDSDCVVMQAGDSLDLI